MSRWEATREGGPRMAGGGAGAGTKALDSSWGSFQKLQEYLSGRSILAKLQAKHEKLQEAIQRGGPRSRPHGPLLAAPAAAGLSRPGTSSLPSEGRSLDPALGPEAAPGPPRCPEGPHGVFSSPGDKEEQEVSR